MGVFDYCVVFFICRLFWTAQIFSKKIPGRCIIRTFATLAKSGHHSAL